MAWSRLIGKRFILFVVICLLVASCAKEREKKEESKVIEPAHHWGEECAKCHTDWNLNAMHDANSSRYNSECIKCHGNMLWEESLDSEVEAIHPKMIKYVLPETGEEEITNTTCVYCHKSVDFVESSAGNIRKQVASTVCAECHAPKGGAKVLYVE
jgi:hypothetical protein